MKRLLNPFLQGRTVLCLWIACWIAILIAGLWPLQFHPKNGATWLKSGGGIQFSGRGIVYSSAPLATMLGSSEFTLELVLRPHSAPPHQLASIVTDNGPENAPGFALEQWHNNMLLKENCHEGSSIVVRKTGAADAELPNQIVHIAMASGNGRTDLYVNGHLAGVIPCAIVTEELTGPLILGNTGLTNSPWAGDVLAVAIYRRKLSDADILADGHVQHFPTDATRDPVALFDFSEGNGEIAHNRASGDFFLHVPPYLVLLKRMFLEWQLRATESGVQDVIINILGFIPFGLLGTAVLSSRQNLRRSVLLTTIIGFALSLAIEVTQSWLPTRDSSSTDLLMNTLGTAIGAVLFVILARKQKQMQTKAEAT